MLSLIIFLTIFILGFFNLVQAGQRYIKAHRKDPMFALNPIHSFDTPHWSLTYVSGSILKIMFQTEKDPESETIRKNFVLRVLFSLCL